MNFIYYLKPIGTYGTFRKSFGKYKIFYYFLKLYYKNDVLQFLFV